MRTSRIVNRNSGENVRRRKEMTERMNARMNETFATLGQASTSLIVERWRNSPAVPPTTIRRIVPNVAIYCWESGGLSACLLACLPSHSWMHFHVITGSPRRSMRTVMDQFGARTPIPHLSQIIPLYSIFSCVHSSPPVFVRISFFFQLTILLASF